MELASARRHLSIGETPLLHIVFRGSSCVFKRNRKHYQNFLNALDESFVSLC